LECSHLPTGRRTSSVERDVADILIQLDDDGIGALDSIFMAHGLKVKQMGALDIPGIPKGGRVWMLLRDPSTSTPEYISSDIAIGAVSLRDTETVETTTIWFLHIWLTFLSLIYTRTGRSISEVSQYITASFSKGELIRAVGEHIEQVRSVGVGGGIHQTVFDVLDSEKGRDTSRRVSGFLKVLESSKLIVATESDEYQQTLLGAIEMADNYNRSLAHIIPDASILDNIVNIGTDGAKSIQDAEENNVSDQ